MKNPSIIACEALAFDIAELCVFINAHINIVIKQIPPFIHTYILIAHVSRT